MNKLQILLVDDHKVVRLGLRALLDSEPDLTVVGEAESTAEAIRLAEQLQPHLILMDVRLPDQSGISACRQIRQKWPAIQVLMLTSFADEELVLDAINAGAAGYVLKQLDTTDLLKAVRAVGQGDAVLDPAVTKRVLQQMRQAQRQAQVNAFRGLSEREVEVLALVAEGKTNAEIAERLILSEKTVRNHVSTILEKLEVTNRIEAATYAVRNHIERYTAGSWE